jgi:hypothetical protein
MEDDKKLVQQDITEKTEETKGVEGGATAKIKKKKNKNKAKKAE